MSIKRVFFLIFFFSTALFSQIFTQEEKDWIKDNPTISISISNTFEPFSYDFNSEARGFTIDIIKEIEKISGLKLRLQSYSWAKSLENFKEKNTDIIADITFSKEREEFALFTKPYYKFPIYIFGLKQNKELKTLKGKTVAITKGVFYKQELQKQGIVVVEFNNDLEKANAVVTGKAQYFLTSFSSGKKVIRNNGFYSISALKKLDFIKKEDLRFATHKQNFILRNILNKSIDQIDENFINNLKDKWLINSNVKDKIQFTKKEIEYIKNKKKVTFSSINWNPLSIIKNNKMSGILGDYQDLISQKTGLEFEYIPSLKLQEVIEKFNKGIIDVIPGVSSVFQEKTQGVLSNSYIKYPFVIVAKDDYAYINSLMDIEDAVIAVPKYYTSYNLIVKNYPNIKLHLSENIPDAVIAVEKGNADFFVGHIATTLYYQSKYALKDLKIIGRTFFDMEHHYLIQNDNIILQGIINKALNSITLEEKRGIDSNLARMTKLDKNVDYELILLIFLVFLLVVMIFSYRQNLLKKYNNKLKNSYKDIQSIMDSTIEAIIISHNNKCIGVNNSAIKLFEYNFKSDFLGKNILDFVANDCKELVESNILKNITKEYEVDIVTKNNKRVRVLVKGENLQLIGKNVRLFSIIDITDLKNKEKLLIEQSKMVALGEMIGNIAHQWRQPLNAMTVIASSWEINEQMGNFDKKEVLNEAKIILSNANYLSQTIDDFRIFIKEENYSSEFNIKSVIENLIRLENLMIKNENIELILDNDVNKVIYGNRNKFLQALVNIVNNSIQALSKIEEMKLLFISIKELDNEKIRLEFKDNAGGINDDIIDKIFEPYFTTKHQSEGTGLGLYLTYTILKNQDATIDVKNTEYTYNDKAQKGVIFSIDLYAI